MRIYSACKLIDATDKIGLTALNYGFWHRWHYTFLWVLNPDLTGVLFNRTTASGTIVTHAGEYNRATILTIELR
jgi:hypothetical protein